MTNGRVGTNGKRVHILEYYLPTSGYAKSLCGWAGLGRPTEDPVSCYECQRIDKQRRVVK